MLVRANFLVLGCGVLAFGLDFAGSAEPAASLPKPVPNLQVLPLPYDQASFQLDGYELTRFHFGSSLIRPFWYPFTMSEGRSLTRMGHPRDPDSHRHHYSVWISHENVGGVNFWADGTGAKIVCQRVLRYDDDTDDEAAMLVENAWQDKEGRTVLVERRRSCVVIVRPSPEAGGRSPRDDWMLLIDLDLSAPAAQPVVLEASAFGLIGVRMAKSIGVNDGGGRMVNSEGQRNEAEVFRKPARWVDYSGLVTSKSAGGITLMDHPRNPGHPTPFHVRDDGWMGASLTLRGPLAVEPGRNLRLRYGLWVHADVPVSEAIEARWQTFSRYPWPDLNSPAAKP